MTKAKNPIPAGHHTVTPQLTLDNAAQAIDWYKKALGAEEVARAVGPDGKIMHAEIKHRRLAHHGERRDGRRQRPEGVRRLAGVAVALRGGLRLAVQARRRGRRVRCVPARWVN